MSLFVCVGPLVLMNFVKAALLEVELFSFDWAFIQPIKRLLILVCLPLQTEPALASNAPPHCLLSAHSAEILTTLFVLGTI